MGVDEFTRGERRRLLHASRLPIVTPGQSHVEGPPPAPSTASPDTLLTPTRDVAGEHVVHFGQLRVERGIASEFVEAERYLCRSPQGLAALHALEHASHETTVALAADDNGTYYPDRHRIEWSPDYGQVNTNGSRLSPAMMLLHEEGHAWEHLAHPTEFARNAARANRAYTDGEEQRNVTWEQSAAIALGEGIRDDHSGLAYVTTHPTAVEPAERPELGQDPAHTIERVELHQARLRTQLGGGAPLPAADPAPNGVVRWDREPHTGPFLHLGANTVAQFVAGDGTRPGQYQLYDVQRDLGGIVPPEHQPRLTVGRDGVVEASGRERASSSPQR